MRYLILCLVFAGFNLNCASTDGTKEGYEDPRTTVEILNNNFYDMNIFVLWSGTRVRLGNVISGATRRFTVPAYVVDSGADLRFQADPIGGSTAPITQTLSLIPGDNVSLIIPNY